MIAIDPECCDKRHGQLHPLPRRRDADRLAFKASALLALLAMVALTSGRPRFPLHPLGLGPHGGVHPPTIGMVEPHLPLSEPLDQLRQGGFVLPPTLPVAQLSCRTIPCFPAPALMPRPHQLQAFPALNKSDCPRAASSCQAAPARGPARPPAWPHRCCRLR